MNEIQKVEPVATKEKLGLFKRIRKSVFVGSREDIKESFLSDILFPSIRELTHYTTP